VTRKAQLPGSGLDAEFTSRDAEHLFEVARLAKRSEIAERALRDITRCDYRGNEPIEQMIARLALADLERVR